MSERSSAHDLERKLIAEIENGLPLVPRPYAEIAGRLGVEESSVIDMVESMKRDGTIKRFGIVVRHRELGYTANAMVVWNVPDDEVDEIGELFGRVSFVTLSYRRPRRLPGWPYNLFTMVHGFDRDNVLNQVARLERMLDGRAIPRKVLFSARRFKQRGARYSSNTAPEAASKKAICRNI